MSALVSVETQGLTHAIDMLKKRSKAFTNLTPAYKKCGAEFVKKTDDAFQDERGYDGEDWEPLKQSTIDKRIGAVKSANRKTKKGTLTKGAQRVRERMMAPGGIKILTDTARARNSNHVTSATKDGFEWSAVGYLGVHMAGTDKAGRSRNVVIPMRNPSPFILVSGDWKLRDSAAKSLEDHIKRHVMGETSFHEL